VCNLLKKPWIKSGICSFAFHVLYGARSAHYVHLIREREISCDLVTRMWKKKCGDMLKVNLCRIVVFACWLACDWPGACDVKLSKIAVGMRRGAPIIDNWQSGWPRGGVEWLTKIMERERIAAPAGLGGCALRRRQLGGCDYSLLLGRTSSTRQLCFDNDCRIKRPKLP
jgi:hypothetical protein